MDIKTTAREKLLMNLSCYDTAFALMLVIGLWALFLAFMIVFFSIEGAFALVLTSGICFLFSVVAKAYYMNTLWVIKSLP